MRKQKTVTVDGKKYVLLKKGRENLSVMELEGVSYKMQRINSEGKHLAEVNEKEYEIKALGRNYLPTEEGVYLARRVWGREDPEEIDVYSHPIKGLSCFAEDFGSSGAGVDDETDCHVSVQNTGLEFITKVRDLS